ncbi:MAG: chemotaxis protein CheW [Granulosicoccus sp.]
MSVANSAQVQVLEEADYSERSQPAQSTDFEAIQTTTSAANAESFAADAPRSEARGMSIYGSFSIGASEFALPVSVVQEVVNDPEHYYSVPLSPDYLSGLFNLRGNVIPVVDLRKIFKLELPACVGVEDAQICESRKVAIIEYGNLCLGLLFDSTGEVFNDTEAQTCLFKNHEPTIQDQVIAGVFKMDGGSRIVQLLDVAGILRLDRIPQSAHDDGTSSSAHRRGKRRQCISFDVGDSCCALDIGAIKEIVNIGSIENTVLAGSLCLGAIDLRGNTVPIVNFSLLLGYNDAANEDIHESDSHRVIIMKVEDHSFGLLVSRINNIVSYFDDELIAFPVLGNQKTALFQGCVSGTTNKLQTIVLEQNEIFSNKEIELITKGHSALFKENKEPTFKEKQGSLNRKTLITFSLDNAYGLEISDVKEVIDYPYDLIKTPTMTRHIRGMANLRGELVAIIDTRELYALDTFTDHLTTKVLVFEVDKIKYGLMVDSVDSIVPFRNSDTIDIPGIVFNSEDGVIDKDIKEAIMITRGSTQQTVCILDLESVARRASSD